MEVATSKKIVGAFSVDSYGVDHAQYFASGGTNGYDDAATGIGDTAREAAHDALESLAQNGWDFAVPSAEDAMELDEYTETEMLLKEIEELDNTRTVVDDLKASLGASYDREYTDDDPTGECYFYVVIRLSEADATPESP